MEFRRHVAAIRLTLDLLPQLNDLMPGVVATALTAAELLAPLPAAG